MLGILLVAVKAFLRHDIDTQAAIPLFALLALPYSAGLLTFFYAREHFIWSKAARYTLIALAITAAAIVLIKFLAPALPALGGSDDDDDSSHADSNSGGHPWSTAWSGGLGDAPYGASSRSTLPPMQAAACPGCGRNAGFGQHGLCIACSPFQPGINPWGV